MVGSLWAVRSSTAWVFAETFYQQFVRDGSLPAVEAWLLAGVI
ncbi:MAG TPA: hypothetical protein VK784_07420 [Pseudonocardiaceae bacterium]|nr:hypothetical protein [Pseudonocardiaceae bacterium]